LGNTRTGPSRPELNRAKWQRTRAAVGRRDGERCRHCGADGQWAQLSVHHLTPANLGGSDEMDNLITLCGPCHRAYEQAARTLTLPVDTEPRKRTSMRKRTPQRRHRPHGAPFRGPDGQPWSRQWLDY
jgi:5-methylcytosine-specific restriction endonuclease McrA